MFRGNDIRIIEDWQRDSLDVFVFAGRLREDGIDGEQKILRTAPNNQWIVEDVGDPDPFTGRPEPSLRIPIDLVEALIAHAKKGRPSLDSDDAISDARATRDRLLSIVETVADRVVENPVSLIERATANAASYTTTNYFNEGGKPS